MWEEGHTSTCPYHVWKVGRERSGGVRFAGRSVDGKLDPSKCAHPYYPPNLEVIKLDTCAKLARMHKLLEEGGDVSSRADEGGESSAVQGVTDKRLARGELPHRDPRVCGLVCEQRALAEGLTRLQLRHVTHPWGGSAQRLGRAAA